MALKGIDETLLGLIACIDSALVEDDAPTCVTATTVGEPQVATCCECSGSGNGELWGNFKRAYPSDPRTGLEVRNRQACVSGMWSAQFQITLARCFPVIDQDGTPEPQDRSDAANSFHADMAAVKSALECCDTIDEKPVVEQITTTLAPTGGCSYLVVTLHVPVSMSRAHNPRKAA